MRKKSEDFKRLLKELRGDRTYRDMEDLTGVSYGSYWNWETTGKVPREDYLRQIADGAGVPRRKVFASVGLGVGDKDDEWDQEKYPDYFTLEPADREKNVEEENAQVLDDALAARVVATDPYAELQTAGATVYRGTDIPLMDGTLPMASPQYRDGEELTLWQFAEGIEGLMQIMAEGDSMEPHYHEGDLILFAPMIDRIRVGEKYIVLIDNEVTCKILELIEVREGEAFFTFAPGNRKYPRMTCAEHRVRFQGIPITYVPRMWLAKLRRALGRG